MLTTCKGKGEKMSELIIALIVIILAAYLIKKKYDIKLVMFGSGILLMLSALLMNKVILPSESSSGVPFFDIFKVMGNLFTKQLSGASFTLLLLFGYTAYMKAIRADEKTVSVLSAPLKHIKIKALLIPIFYLIGNFLCIIIPSSSSLSVMLMATAFPILTSAGVSPLAVGAVIATSATIAPTPLGADNLLASEALGLPVTDYVFNYHAKISIPIILMMAIVHFIWQKRQDHLERSEITSTLPKLKEVTDQLPKFYAILPMLPLLLMLIFYFVSDVNLGISEVIFFSLMVSILCEVIRMRSFQKGTAEIQAFFNGMGVGLTTVVAQVVAALTFVEGLKILGVIDLMGEVINHLNAAGLMLTLAFCLLALFVGLLSGSGLAIFYAFVELMPSFAESVGISAISLAIPMQFVSHLVKSISPVSPTVIIISSMMNVSPVRLIKRTIVPVLVGMVLSIVLTYVIL